MTQPLALVLYEKLLPATQLVNRLQDLNYRVQTLAQASQLVQTAEQLKPMLVMADLESSRQDVCPALAQLKQNPATAHLPIIAFGGDKDPSLKAQAQAAGVTLVVGEAALLSHLPQFLERALLVE